MMDERLTRKRIIDPKLRMWGWDIIPYSQDLNLSLIGNCAIEEYPTLNGPADYTLCSNGTIVGIIEAKKITLGPQNVLTQAERYAKGLNAGEFDFRGLRAPFLYSTNGETIWFHDVRHELNRSRKISQFHTPQALCDMLSRNLAQESKELLNIPNDNKFLRDYQKESNHAVEKAIARMQRLMMVAMATGTGKTYTTVNQIYRLMSSGVARRALFLVDRRALAAQAVRAFASFDAKPGLKFNNIYEVYSQRFKKEDFEDDKFDPVVLPADYLMDPQPGHAFVYVSTVQRMAINLFGRSAIFDSPYADDESDADKLDIPIHAFDLIVADECHRGYTTREESAWRSVLEHFDAIKIGLTATPAVHTKAYFKEIVFNYPFEQAVAEGYLVDYDAVKIKSNIRMNGMFLNEGESIDILDKDTGHVQTELLEDSREFEAEEVEKKVTSPDSNKKIIAEIHKYAEQHEEEYGRFPKMLIFAANDLPHSSHSDQIVDICRDEFGRGDDFVQKITGRVDRPLQKIKEFRNRQSLGIVVTVDMLSTGVDIPDLEYIVFLRTVKSRILFEQMMGRGTRKGEKFSDKSHFTVFDCFDGTLLQYFRETTGITANPPSDMPLKYEEIINDIYNNYDRDYKVRVLVKRLQRTEKQMSGKARDLFAKYIPDGNLGKFARELPSKFKSDFSSTMKILLNKDFQELLVKYPRAKRVFIIATEAEDEVESEWIIRDGLGKEYKPEDYLMLFERFVQENEAKIDAIEILLKRPKDWSPEALELLKKKLSSSKEHFTTENLQKAHAAKYHKALADIISMVKHAAIEESPLLSASERVYQAMNRITAGKEFTTRQQDWLNLIRQHLIENLSINKEDFEYMPIFARKGGWAVANKVFKNHLTELLSNINEEIAA